MKRAQKATKSPKRSHLNFRFTINPFLKAQKTKTGEHPVYLRIGINGQRIRLPVGISMKKEHWSRSIKMASPAHPRQNDVNLIIRQAISRVNDVLILFRLKGKIPTSEDLKKHFHHGAPSDDFLDFAYSELQSRSRELSQETFRTHKGDLSKLESFKSSLTFNDLDFTFLESFDNHMRSNLFNRPNTRHKTLKTIKTYVNRAIKKGLMDHNPFDSFTMKTQKTERTFLTRGEVLKLERLFEEGSLPEALQNTLQSFLFCCFCGGIRVSDVQRLNQFNIRGSMVVFTPQKTSEMSSELVRVPLTERAKKYINEKGSLVPYTSDQVMNRHLKEISKRAEIDKKITFHVSRHTFATLFLKAGGKVEVLMMIMGHQSLKTTMRYVHVTEDSKLDQMKLMNDL